MQSAPRPPDSSDDLLTLDALVPPTTLKFGAVLLSFCGFSAFGLGVQMLWAYAWTSWLLDLAVGAYIVLGLAALVLGFVAVSGRWLAAVAGLALGAILGVITWFPFEHGLLTLTMLAAGPLGLTSAVLLGVSLPACRKMDAARRAALAVEPSDEIPTE